MPSYLLMHEGEAASSVDVSHVSFLSEAPDGHEWVEVPSPAAGHVATPDGAGGYEIAPRIPSLDELRTAKLTEVKGLRDAAEHGGCTVDGVGRFDTDPDSQRKISGAAFMATLSGESFAMKWRLADDRIETLDAPQMIAVGVAVGQHIAACQYRKNALDAELNAAEAYAALMDVDIESGWPS